MGVTDYCRLRVNILIFCNSGSLFWSWPLKFPAVEALWSIQPAPPDGLNSSPCRERTLSCRHPATRQGSEPGASRHPVCLSLSLQAQRGKLRSSQVPGILLSTGQPNTDNQPSYFWCCCTNAVSCGHRASVCVRLLGMCRPWKGTVGFLCQAKAEKGEKIFHFIDARECNSRGRKIFHFGEENTSILRVNYFHGYW